MRRGCEDYLAQTSELGPPFGGDLVALEELGAHVRRKLYQSIRRVVGPSRVRHRQILGELDEGLAQVQWHPGHTHLRVLSEL